MRVLVAFDKFKDCLTASEACAAAAAGLRAAQPDWTIDLCPLADGGEGFAAILTAANGGELRRITVSGPRGHPVDAPLGLVPASRLPAPVRAQLALAEGTGPLALVEMAGASGLALLAPAKRDPWWTTTKGTGQLLRAAREAGAAAIVLGVGGSATHDLGLGALTALGLQARTAGDGIIDPPVPAAWDPLARFTGGPVRLPPVFVACDVTNPLLGPRGAAATYGPQKGLRDADLPRLEAETGRVARLLGAHFGRSEADLTAPGAGAAGGLAFGLRVAVGARLVPGFEFVARCLALEARLAAADLVLTGEGRFDASSWSGKGPGEVAARAVRRGRIVHVFAGAVAAPLGTYPVARHAITPPGLALPEALREGATRLTETVRRVFA